jgi:hypothetical protein
MDRCVPYGSHAAISSVRQRRYSIRSTHKSDHNLKLKSASLQEYLLLRHKGKSPRASALGAVFQVYGSMAVQDEKRGFVSNTPDSAGTGQEVKRRPFVEFLLLYRH